MKPKNRTKNIDPATLSQKQSQLLRSISELFDKHGHDPSATMIAYRLSVTRQAVWKRLERMLERDLVRGGNSGYRLTVDGSAILKRLEA